MQYTIQTRIVSIATYVVEADSPQEAEDAIWNDEVEIEDENVREEEILSIVDENNKELYNEAEEAEEAK